MLSWCVSIGHPNRILPKIHGNEITQKKHIQSETLDTKSLVCSTRGVPPWTPSKKKAPLRGTLCLWRYLTGTISGARKTILYPNVAFRWTPEGGFKDLEGTSANALNDAGTVAGSTLTGAFVLDGTRLSTWDDQGAYGINELGNVSGNKAGKNPYRATSIP